MNLANTLPRIHECAIFDPNDPMKKMIRSKQLFTFAFCVLLMLPSFSQKKCLLVSQLDSAGMRLSVLDSEYLALSSKANLKTVFGTAKKKNQNCIIFQLMGVENISDSFIDAHGMKWTEDTVIFSVSEYFNAVGTIDYWIVDFKSPVQENEKSKYLELIGDFIQVYRLSVQPKNKFRETTTVILER